MTELEAIQTRHAVRSYLDKPLEQNVITKLQEEINQCNQKQNLHFQLIINEENAFKSLIPAGSSAPITKRNVLQRLPPMKN